MTLNNKGQSMIGAVVASALIGISAMALCSLMSSMSIAQARVQRASNWNSTQNNITNVLKNLNSCSATVLQLKTVGTIPQSLSILVAPGTAVLANGQNLGYQLTNAKVNLVAVGTATPIQVTQTVNQTTTTPCGQTQTVQVNVQVTEYIQQA